MRDKKCPKCGNDRIIKNGTVQSKQRYKCKECKYNFTKFDLPGTSTNTRLLAVLLYSSGMSKLAVSKLLKVSDSSIANWIESFSEKIPKDICKQDISVIEFDEMWHFVGKKNKKFGYGKPLIIL